MLSAKVMRILTELLLKIKVPNFEESYGHYESPFSNQWPEKSVGGLLHEVQKLFFLQYHFINNHDN